jgi:hypothetical protein
VKRFLIATLLGIAASVTGLNVGTVFAQDQPPQTPAGYLSRAAGTYIGANEHLRVLAATDCAYVLKRKAPPTTELINKEVLPGFPPDTRKEVSATFSRMLPQLQRQGESQVALMIADATKEQKGDRKTACGYIAGTLVGTVLRAADNWNAARIQF